ncbi:MAG: histidinol dehydrogenase [Gemmatimonadota bacterium]|nr:histidinol dehydrogenase [Gemmatimonadota bacterium]
MRPTAKSLFRYSSTLSGLSKPDRTALFERTKQRDSEVRDRTANILRRVRADGDRALFDMARQYDGVVLGSLETPAEVRQLALASIDPCVRSALERAARNIAAVHSTSPPQTVEVETEPGVIVGRRPDPLQSVGIYAPGGRAFYASSVLMAAVPARAAGVSEIILCSPPRADGYPAPVVLAACEIAGVDRVFAVGGAGAIAAMAYGTDIVPRVDKIVGPGNAYVAEAKLLVSREVSIDSPAGPTELLIICDDSADSETIAREVVAQAEHDVDACIVVIPIGRDALDTILGAIAREIADSPRAEVICAALSQNGAILSAASVSDAVGFANQFAPEHLLLATRDAETLLPNIRNVGSVFIGEQSSVAFGDYITGGNHVLPTGGLARSYSGLGPLDFVRWTYYQKVSRAAARRLSSDAAILADAEGLPGHARAALHWSAP